MKLGIDYWYDEETEQYYNHDGVLDTIEGCSITVFD